MWIKLQRLGKLIPKLEDMHQGITRHAHCSYRLAGSGVLIAAAMAAMKTVGSSLLFCIIFNTGCIAGMMLAAAIPGLPFSEKLKSFEQVQEILVVGSCIICVIRGARIKDGELV